MPMIDRNGSELLLIDFQERLMPAIADADVCLRNAGRLLAAARILGVPHCFTVQNPEKLGPTVAVFGTGQPSPQRETVLSKMSFDALGDPVIAKHLQSAGTVIVTGVEAHVCVLQTVLGLLARGRRVCVVADAIGSRSPANLRAAVDRMRAEGAEIVTTEMVVFEWLGSADNPAFREIVALIK